ncbi:Chaperone protein DnaK [Frankliniella fusca]|uniref:Chaperone protein DnaK n=1 Tax=Frankliniella fusca TaxID=407009 RepID=A0AAE1LNM1_9NEOP|nr:Chaperone protein DnaK [Frankliniella fusca]
MLSKLRKVSVIDGIGTEEPNLPTSAKLPTSRDVLRTFFFHMRNTHEVRHGARTAVSMVYKVWQTMKVPCVQEIRAIEKVEKLYHEYRALFKNTPKNPNLKPGYVEKLDMLFDISKKDAVAYLEGQILNAKAPAEKKGWEEEKLFLLDQQGPRLFVIGGVDVLMRAKDVKRAEAEKRKIERLLEWDARRKKEEERRRAAGERVESDVSEFSDSCPDDSPVKPKRGRKDVVSPELVEALDAAKVSNTQVTKIIAAAMASTSGTPVNETNLNKTTVSGGPLGRKDLVVSLSDKNKSQDRLAIIVTGVNTAQVLGTPVEPDASAVEAKKAVVEHLERWKLGSKVKALSFDTTSANSGCRGGAALLISLHFGREMLWLPCRHHVFERVLEVVFHTVMGPSTGPEPTLFKELQRAWASLDKTRFCTYKDFAASRAALGPCADGIVKFAISHIEVGQPRDDYLELLEVSILFLGGFPPKGIRFHPPGPIHSARWMAKAIYTIKMTLLRRQLRLEPGVANGLLKVAAFVVRKSHAPRRYLLFLKRLIQYEKVNKPIAKAAQSRFLNHLWYLSEESMGFAVFDEELSDQERQQIAENILHKEGDDDPPKKRSLHLSDLPDMCLSDLATTHTKNFFIMLGLKYDFLDKPVREWSDQEDYRRAREIVMNLKVVNDQGERGVKLMNDYNGVITKKEDHFQDLLVNVHAHRQSVPNVKKETLIKKYDK